MRIATITRIKHGRLYEALQRIGWTQSKLARKIGTDTSSIGRIINLKHRPSDEMADRIMVALLPYGEHVNVLDDWPEGLAATRTSITRFVDADPKQIADATMGRSLPSAIEYMEAVERAEIVESSLGRLRHKQRRVVRMHYFDGMSYTEIARAIGCSVANGGHLHDAAIKVLQRPCHSIPLSEVY